MGLTDTFRRLFQSANQSISYPGGQRDAGPPTSSNGASSFHLDWQLPPKPLREVSVTIEVVESPAVPELYFWALQVNFTRNGLPAGGAHVGLQHHPNYPSSAAVNWGGYANEGGELAGSSSELPSALDNPNTRTYHWLPQRRYRYRVFVSPERGWRASITDLGSAEGPSGQGETVIRDLYVDADALTAPAVWSEVFANCDHPSSAVRWSDFSAVASDGSMITPRGLRLNYQSVSDGGCSNTNSALEAASDGSLGVVQRTNAQRVNQTGTMLRL